MKTVGEVQEGYGRSTGSPPEKFVIYLFTVIINDHRITDVPNVTI